MYAQAAARGAAAASTVAAVAGGAAGSGGESDVEVRKEDQEMINEFGTLNSRFHELDEDLRGLKDQLEKLDDAVTELMVGSGGNVRLLLGEAFVEVSEDYATEYCEKRQEQLQARVDELSAEKERVTSRQQELKKALYGRFGNSINLEDK